MDEIEYKLNTNNSVLVVNAVDKLISTIKSKYKSGERQKFVLDNEELRFLRDKCSVKEPMVSLTACQGLLALVELGVLEIGHTMSTIVTLLPSAHNYTAIISTMAGLLTLDLKSRLVPGQPYRCQFSLRSPQHPLVTVLERSQGAENDVITQMHALCTHPDYIVSSNSLELLRPVFLWLSCECSRAAASPRPWQLLLSLPPHRAQAVLLLAALSCQQICNPKLLERAFAAYSAVTDAAIYQQRREYVMAVLPILARISNEFTRHGRDPRACYSLIERCFSLDAPELKSVAGITVMLLAENLTNSSALYLHELFNLCLNIITKYEYSSISLNILASLSLQWLHLPSYLTSSALKVASKILETYKLDDKEDTRLHMSNLKSNPTFQTLLYTDSHLSIVFKLNQTWERIRDEPNKIKSWLDSLNSVDDVLKLELLPFFIGIMMEKRKDAWFEEIVLKALDIVIGLVNSKEVAVQVMPILLYKIANDKSPNVKMECLKALPLMAKTKENVPTIVSVLNKIKASKGVPMSFLIMLYTSLAETQVRCFPYLQEMLVEPGPGRPDDLKWETEIARAMAVRRICEIRPSSHGLELVSVISSILNKCTDRVGSVATCLALQALVHLWRGAAVAPPSTWRALEPKLGRDNRLDVQISICKLLSEAPGLRLSTPEYSRLLCDATHRLWRYMAEEHHPALAEAACDALAAYRIEDYTLKDIPEIYRRTVKLPPSYCKTPADAARNPEDVLDYIPCEVWPEVFKYTNQEALPGVERLVTKLMDREVRGYRSGVYQPDAKVEPQSLSYLPHTSVVRGLLECFRRQAITPSYDFPTLNLLSLLRSLTASYPRPLPPLDLCFLHEACHRGAQWRPLCLKLAARQAHTAGSARRLVDNYLQGVVANEDSDVDLIFELLPILCRGMPPNSLRPIIEKCLGESYSSIANIKAKDVKNIKHFSDLQRLSDQQEDSNSMKTEYVFVNQLLMIKECLDSDRIHDANRTLLSQIVENYFSVIQDNNVSWPIYIQVCTSLSTKYLERMTSPSGWWEVSSELIRKACAVRCAVAAITDCDGPLVWLNEIIDAQATQITEQEYSLQCMLGALRAAAARPDQAATKAWFLQLMARTQVAFTETDDQSAKLYLCDVFMLSVIVFCGHWSFEPDLKHLTANRAARQALLPSAAASLMARGVWGECTLQMLEWLCHTRDSIPDRGTERCCQRALLALRHTEPFVAQRMWRRLENHFGKNTVDE